MEGRGCACWPGGACHEEPKHLEEPQDKVRNMHNQLRIGENLTLDVLGVQYSQVESGSEALSSVSISNRAPTSNSTSLDHCG